MKHHLELGMIVCGAAMIAILLYLQGCSSGTTSISTAVGGVETNSSDIGRFTAWAAVEQKKAETIQAIEEAENTTAPQQNVQVVLDTEAKIQAWANYQTVVALKDSVVAMARALKPRSKTLEPTPMPKGAGAEFVDSSTGFVGAIVNSPVGVASSVGYFIGNVAKGAVSENKITATEGSTVNISKTSTSGESVANVTSTASGTMEPAEPIIVEPFIIE